MKKVFLYILPLLLLALTSCNDDPIEGTETFNYKAGDEITGNIIKGPFLKDATITIFELDEKLNKTGKSISTTTYSDLGDFTFTHPGFNGEYVLIVAEGFYYNELSNTTSDNTIELTALANINNNGYFSVNVISHILLARTKQLVKQNYSIERAYEKAIDNICILYGKTIHNYNFHNLSLIDNTDNNSILLATTLLTLMGGESNNNIYQTIDKLTTDLADNGKIDDKVYINSLKKKISTEDCNTFEENIEAYYTQYSQTVDIPSFQKILFDFLENNSVELPVKDSITYPENPDFINILSSPNSILDSGNYSIAADIPADNTVVVKFSATSENFQITSDNIGWVVKDKTDTSFTLTTQRENQVVELHLILKDEGSAIIEIFENNSKTPLIKTISWE